MTFSLPSPLPLLKFLYDDDDNDDDDNLTFSASFLSVLLSKASLAFCRSL